jgi:lipopolysaccharide export system protein LptA
LRVCIIRAVLFAGAILTANALPYEAFAQGAEVAFGGLSHDNTLPVEVTADSLRIEQETGIAVFSGSVRVGQGDLKLAADTVEVTYAREGENNGTIQYVKASGNVTLTNGAEAAEGETADYDLASGLVTMEGSVLLTQGQNALSGEKLRIDLTTGVAQMEGRVQTVFQPQQRQDQ